jgi:hypothetical protein
MSKPTLKVTKDFTERMNDIVKRFRHDEVLVGIPEQETARKEDEDASEPINNATILAINEFGSPANNIPPRPVMAIGIRKAKDEIAEQFKKAAIAALSAGFSAVDTFYDRAGFAASMSVKKTINEQDGIDKPSDATLTARKAMGFKGEKALIVTGQTRNAITFVRRGGGD